MVMRIGAWVMLLLVGCTGTLSSRSDEGRRDGGTTRDDAGTFVRDGSVASDADLAVDGGGTPIDGGVDGGVDSGPTDPCAGVSCPANAACDPRSRACFCRPGFVDDGAACVAPPAGDPATRTEADVCEAWRTGHVENARPAWSGSGACGPGTMAPEAIDDTLRRINLFRWLAGLPPVSDRPEEHDAQMECAAMMSANGALSHSPPESWDCYTSAGAGAAGRSNIALGYGTPGAAIDGYMLDRNTPSLGHRRWILNPPLGRVGIGFASPSRPGQCLSVFDRSGSGSERTWTAYPNPGPSPMFLAQGEWSFQTHGISLSAGSSATVVRVGDGMTLPVTTRQTGGGGPPNSLVIVPDGWTPEAGQTYRVTVDGLSVGEISYEVTLVEC
ncbi:MAG: hypothetical protein H6721_05985 [Sandaracinus sp.]|nr:hypothetical protein [Sandaracinus sp.]MCB9620124.1 hypothetical protein [Sandaracinus sp.]MCB9631674.1 hypothetical protein [Sandaracinus sp.]